MIKEMIESAAKAKGVVGVMSIAAVTEKRVGVSYSRLSNLLNGKGKVPDLIAVLACFDKQLKSVPLKGEVK